MKTDNGDAWVSIFLRGMVRQAPNRSWQWMRRPWMCRKPYETSCSSFSVSRDAIGCKSARGSGIDRRVK
jgi:hypothetical protein